MKHTADPLAGLSSEERRQLLLRLLEQQQTTPDVAPLSSAQARLWFLDQLVPLSPLYNVSLAFHIRGPLQTSALGSCLDAVVARHEILRTAFESVDGRPQQVVADRVSLPLPVVDLAALPAPVGEAEATRFTVAAARRPFHLDRCPLVRSLLVRLGPRRHQLVLTLHHILADGWSMGVLYRELTALYATAASTTTRPRKRDLAGLLPELPIQYADFAVWQREWLASDEQAHQLGYWCDHLAGAPERLSLPFDRARPAQESFRGAQHGFSFDPELGAALEALSRHCGVTLFMTLLAGFSALLYRLTGQDDLVLGTPIANRHRQEVEPLIGLFVNTLALRLRPLGEHSFDHLLRQTEATALGAYDHQDLPFERLIEELRPERSLSHNPLCQVLFALQNYPAEALTLGDLELEPLADAALDTGTSKFDLTLYLWQLDGTLTGLFEYNVDLFDPPTLERLGGQLQQLLRSAAAEPDAPLDHLALLRPAERRQLLDGWNPKPSAYPREATLGELFRASARRHGATTALRFADGELSYRELLQRGETLARSLKALGVGPEATVGLALERSAAMVVAMVGVALAGGAYVPLDPSYPESRLAFMANDAGIEAVICDPRMPTGLTAGRERLELMAGGALLGTLPDGGAATPPGTGRRGDPLHTAYIIYTSGSTGTPKGVAVPQRAVTRLVLATNYAQLHQDDVVAQASNAAFDATTWEVWGALLNGASLVGIPREVALDPGEMAAVLDRQGITALFLTTALFNQLAAQHPTAFAGIRHLLFGGELVDPDKVRRVLEHGPPRRLLHVYGPTECTTFAAWHLVRAVSAAEITVPIGGPLANTRLQVVDRSLEPAPPGFPGELWIGGDGLARGYLGHPARTAQRFVPDPFAGPEHPGARLYRTGDLVRRRGDGAILFVGRVDHQVKIRGFRVEPGEIENELLQHPEVDEAIVLARESRTADDTRDRRLVAYIASRQPDTDNKQGVEAWRDIYDEAIYQDLEGEARDPADPTFNVAGWTSSFTGEPIPAAEMREQVEGSLARLRALSPSRVLEIGCGTGLLLFPLAATCRSFWGTDFSRVALDYLERQLAASPLPGVRLFEAAADDFSAVDRARGGELFDLVVLNSVAQYFPSTDYLEKVVSAALERLAPGGTIFLGDLRFLPLLELLTGALELHRAPDDIDRSQLRARVAAAREAEGELLLGPAFFHQLQDRLPLLAEVRIWPKRGRGDNELARFRADVVLHRAGGAEPAETAVAAEPWPEGWDLDDLRETLRAGTGPRVFLAVPNPRLERENQLRQWLGAPVAERSIGTVSAWRKQLARSGPTTPAGIHPEDLLQLEQELRDEITGERSWHLEPSWQRGDPTGCYDLLAWRRGQHPPQSPGLATDGPAANHPLAARRRRQLAPRLRRFAAERLPAHMVPAGFVVLQNLPLTANGKVDRRALAALGDGFEHQTGGFEPGGLEGGGSGNGGPGHAGARGFVAPRTPAEKGLARIWSEVLGISPIGVHDDFFELGGHSLLATQVASRIRSTFRVEMPLATLFEVSELSALAERLMTLLMESLAAMDETEAVALLAALNGPEEVDHAG